MESGWTPIAMAQKLVMPDLASGEEFGRGNLARMGYRNAITGLGVPAVEGSYAHAHYKNFVRHVDTAVRRYESAKQFLQQVIGRPPERDAVPEIVRGLSELESMFNHLHRSIGLLTLLKKAREAPVKASDLKPFDEDAIQQIRHATEHIEKFRRGVQIADPIIGLTITLVILKITWDSWNTVRKATIDLDHVGDEHDHETTP